MKPARSPARRFGFNEGAVFGIDLHRNSDFESLLDHAEFIEFLEPKGLKLGSQSMNELLLCEWVRAAAPGEQTNFIVRSVAPLVRDAEFERSTHGYFVSRHGDKQEKAEVCLRVFAEDPDDPGLCALVDAHTGGSMRFKTPFRADPMLAPELEWYRRALTLVTNVAIEVLESSSFRLSSALLSERDIFSRVGRSIIAKVLSKHSTTYRSLSPEESRLFWSELSTNSSDTILPCRPGHWLWNLLAY